MFNATHKSLPRLCSELAALALGAMGLLLPLSAGAQMSGGIYTTNSACNGVDLNIYAAKTDVYLYGGPQHGSPTSLPDGVYFVKVTTPDNDLLGTSAPNTVATVSGGVFSPCLSLYDATHFGDTTNAGGEYKVWLSQDIDFPDNLSKTDNFKVNPSSTTTGTGTLIVQKFYDKSTDGIRNGDPLEPLIEGWKVNISDCIDQDAYTTVSEVVDPGLCTVREYMPTQTNWIRTSPSTTDTITVTVPSGGTATAVFGNVCIGAGGGHTLGYWSNKNGQSTIAGLGNALTVLPPLNLVNADGTPFDSTYYPDFRAWILGATATNMAYMLSAQLAAMRLNVSANPAVATTLIYAPGLPSLTNTAGFATVQVIMDAANAALVSPNNVTIGASAARTYQELLKNALDNANNNLTFVQSTPCPRTFE